jgi:hypothetical protein
VTQEQPANSTHLSPQLRRDRIGRWLVEKIWSDWSHQPSRLPVQLNWSVIEEHLGRKPPNDYRWLEEGVSDAATGP